MKQKDIALIIIIVFVSGMLSFFASRYLLVPSDVRTAQVEVVEPITSDFTEPDKRYFNEKSINPTETIEIGGNLLIERMDDRPFHHTVIIECCVETCAACRQAMGEPVAEGRRAEIEKRRRCDHVDL